MYIYNWAISVIYLPYNNRTISKVLRKSKVLSSNFSSMHSLCGLTHIHLLPDGSKTQSEINKSKDTKSERWLFEFTSVFSNSPFPNACWNFQTRPTSLPLLPPILCSYVVPSLSVLELRFLCLLFLTWAYKVIYLIMKASQSFYVIFFFSFLLSKVNDSLIYGLLYYLCNLF